MTISRRGFTLIELIITMIVVSILATITIISYGTWRHQTDESVVKNDIIQATTGLTSYMNFKSSYPPNLAGIDFTTSSGVALTLYTDAPSIGVYENITPEQNAQLFLNVCNANLNGLNNTVCTFAGNGGGAKIHVKGTQGTNTIWRNPINMSDVTLPYGPDYTAATNAMVEQFDAQGGTFPIIVSGSSVSLPAPTQKPNGAASNYCIEGRSGDFPDITYHNTPGNVTPIEGVCPSNPSLHYYP